MHFLKTLAFVTILFISANCNDEPAIDGLWVVESVRAGDQEMTPNARWIRFHSDFTQESGNGWFQHSFGTWTFDQDNQTLVVFDTKGIVDPGDPFSVSFEDENMFWNRTEEGQPVEVKLQKANQLPATYGDQLLGLWQLEKAIGEGIYLPESENTNDILFLRWDRRFEIRTENGRVTGVYNVHGHRPELELIPYGDTERNFWKVEFGEESITIQLLNSETEVTRTFKRIREFPQ